MTPTVLAAQEYAWSLLFSVKQFSTDTTVQHEAITGTGSSIPMTTESGNGIGTMKRMISHHKSVLMGKLVPYQYPQQSSRLSTCINAQ